MFGIHVLFQKWGLGCYVTLESLTCQFWPSPMPVSISWLVYVLILLPEMSYPLLSPYTLPPLFVLPHIYECSAERTVASGRVEVIVRMIQPPERPANVLDHWKRRHIFGGDCILRLFDRYYLPKPSNHNAVVTLATSGSSYPYLLLSQSLRVSNGGSVSPLS